jgi:branched-chain amino acid transport system permease protein
VLGVNVSWHEGLAFVLAAVVAGALWYLLRRTRAGITMRAVVDDRPLAMLNGARPDRSALAAWALGCSLAALAGILLAPLQTLSHTPLTLLIVNAYAAAMLGRLRNLPLTFVGAVLLGLLDSYGFSYLPSSGRIAPFVAGLRPAIPVLVLFIVLIVLPSARLRTGAGRRRLVVPRPSWGAGFGVAGGVLAVGLALAVGLPEADTIPAAKAVGLALIALSLVPLVGWAGQLCLCQMSFAGVGAVCMAHLGGGGNPWGLLAAALVGAVVGLLVALPAARLSGIELALATAAFAVVLDRWIFSSMPTIFLGPIHIRTFDRGNVNVDKLSLPGVGSLDNRGTLAALVVALALFHLVVVAARRSRWGDRLLALRESPAACATIGLDPAAARLAVFAASAAMAAVGGGLYATTLGSITPSTFDLFQSLPLLLVTVAGGVGATGGALFGATVLGSTPVLAATFPSFAGVLGVLPGLIGLTLGRNPDGVTPDLARRVSPLRGVALVAVLAVEAAVVALWLADTLPGWWAAPIAFLVPFIAARVVDRRAVVVDPLDDLESRPLGPADIAELDRALSLAEVAP